jgi:hypothetical protein
MKYFLRQHKASILIAPPQALQTPLPITNIEEPGGFRKSNFGVIN